MLHYLEVVRSSSHEPTRHLLRPKFQSAQHPPDLLLSQVAHGLGGNERFPAGHIPPEISPKTDASAQQSRSSSDPSRTFNDFKQWMRAKRPVHQPQMKPSGQSSIRAGRGTVVKHVVFGKRL